MSFPVDVLAMSGEAYRVTAMDHWSVLSFKDVVEKAGGPRSNLQRLVSAEGLELLDHLPLCNFCCPGLDAAQLTLVAMSKPQGELEWLERWHKVTPAWLQTASRRTMDNADFIRLGLSTHTTPHPTKVLTPLTPGLQVPKAPEKSEPIMNSAAEVLAAVNKYASGRKARGVKYALVSIHIYGCRSDNEVKLEWSRSDSRSARNCHRISRTATLDAVLAAVAAEPSVMLDCSEVDKEDLVEIVLAAILRFPGVFHTLPNYLQEERDIVYAAMEADPAIKAEFLLTADAEEIRDWRKYEWRK